MFCWLHVKIRETRPMGHKLTCGTNLTNLFQTFTDFNPNLFFIIIWSLMQVTSLLNKLDIGYKFDCVICFASVIVIRLHRDIWDTYITAS